MTLAKLSAGGAAAAQAVYAVQLNVEVNDLGRDLFEKSAMCLHLP